MLLGCSRAVKRLLDTLGVLNLAADNGAVVSSFVCGLFILILGVVLIGLFEPVVR